MKKSVSTLLFAASIATSAMAFATADDDAKWIKKCVSDNKREGATPEVVAAYCACMNDKMGEEETQSITQWEQSHKAEMADCDAKAGWK
jgi:hypothetical protein